jgi:hypothetical protein
MDKRKILQEKLKQRMAENKAKSNPPSISIEKKIKNEIDEEKKLIDNDSRVTYTMKKLYINAIASSTNIGKIDNPVYILDNMEECSLKFYNFLEVFMKAAKEDVDDWRKDMTARSKNLASQSEIDSYMRELEVEYDKKIKGYLLTPYISYISFMTNINVFV